MTDHYQLDVTGHLLGLTAALLKAWAVTGGGEATWRQVAADRLWPASETAGRTRPDCYQLQFSP